MGTECNGCGRCCDPVVLPFSPIQIQSMLPADAENAANLRWMKQDLTPIPRRQGLEEVGDYMTQGAKTVGAEGPTGPPQVMFSFFYRCRHYDPEGRRCLAYDRRPPACSAYPWGEAPPDRQKALPLECAFRADIDQPVKLLPTRHA